MLFSIPVCLYLGVDIWPFHFGSDIVFGVRMCVICCRCSRSPFLSEYLLMFLVAIHICVCVVSVFSIAMSALLISWSSCLPFLFGVMLSGCAGASVPFAFACFFVVCVSVPSLSELLLSVMFCPSWFWASPDVVVSWPEPGGFLLFGSAARIPFLPGRL